jgi:hypothetical protein
MSKNHRIEARVSEDIKLALERKAEVYGGVTRFLEELARKDIILVDKKISHLLKIAINK